MNHAGLNRITIYTRRMDQMVAFYETHFGYKAHIDPEDRIVELTPPNGGAILMFHPLAKSQKEGQVLVKLGFDVEDVHAFINAAARKGLKFGAVHKGDGYIYSNAKDPAKNSISITSRGFR